MHDSVIGHEAWWRKQALADLLTRLETATDVTGVTEQQIRAAQAEVARHMGW